MSFCYLEEESTIHEGRILLSYREKKDFFEREALTRELHPVSTNKQFYRNWYSKWLKGHST